MKKLVFALFAAMLIVGTTAFAQSFDELMYEIELKEGDALILIKIEDADGDAMEGVIVSIQQGFHRKPFSRVSDKKGIIKLAVPSGNVYSLKFLTLDPSVKQHVEKFNIPQEDELRYSLVMTYTPPTTKVFVLKGVLFNTGKATLKKSSYEKLQPLLEYLKLKENLVIELGGHTDSVGNDEDNQKLSEDRAKTVRKYLVEQGIEGRRITAVGYGETSPIASNDTKAGRKKNRRTEVKILNE